MSMLNNQMVNPSFLMFHSAFLAANAADSPQDIIDFSGQWLRHAVTLRTAWPMARAGPRETESTNGFLGLLQAMEYGAGTWPWLSVVTGDFYGMMT